MKNIKNIIIGVLILISSFFIYDFFTREKEVVEVPVKILVPVPSKEGSSDTIYKPIPGKTITVENALNQELSSNNKKLIEENKILLEKYKKADSIAKLNQYNDAISIREYNQKFIDTFQTVEVYSKTRGKLLEQSINYKTNKYFIPLDTTVTTKIKGKFKVLGQLEVGTPILNDNNFNKIIVKPSIIFQNSKNNGISLSVDTQGNGYLGVLIKL